MLKSEKEQGWIEYGDAESMRNPFCDDRVGFLSFWVRMGSRVPTDAVLVVQTPFGRADNGSES